MIAPEAKNAYISAKIRARINSKPFQEFHRQYVEFASTEKTGHTDIASIQEAKKNPLTAQHVLADNIDTVMLAVAYFIQANPGVCFSYATEDILNHGLVGELEAIHAFDPEKIQTENSWRNYQIATIKGTLLNAFCDKSIFLSRTLSIEELDAPKSTLFMDAEPPEAITFSDTVKDPTFYGFEMENDKTKNFFRLPMIEIAASEIHIGQKERIGIVVALKEEIGEKKDYFNRLRGLSKLKEVSFFANYRQGITFTPEEVKSYECAYIKALLYRMQEGIIYPKEFLIAVNTITPEKRDTILKYFGSEKKTYRQIAKESGISTESVSVRIETAINSLRENTYIRERIIDQGHIFGITNYTNQRRK